MLQEPRGGGRSQYTLYDSGHVTDALRATEGIQALVACVRSNKRHMGHSEVAVACNHLARIAQIDKMSSKDWQAALVSRDSVAIAVGAMEFPASTVLEPVPTAILQLFILCGLA